jgi:hypothetical protein
VAYERRRVEPKTVEATTPMDIEKGRIICEYCGKSNHTASVCRKKIARIKIEGGIGKRRTLLQVW